MPRVSPILYDRHIEESQEPEDREWSGDDSAGLSRIKLGTAWSCVTVAGIVSLGYSTISQLSPTLTMLGLVALLAAYAGYGFFLAKKNTVQFADSLYYMGFLWALFALIATLLIWPAPRLTTDAVLTTFGYALVVTFCGMLLRQVILQFQDTLPDRLVHAQDTLDRRMASLTQQINEATMEMTAFRERAANDLGGTLYDLVQSLGAVREKLADQQVRMANATSEGFESSLREILGRFSAIHIPQEMLTAEVGKLAEALGRRGEHFEQAAQGLEQRLKHAAETVTAFGESLCGSEAAQQVGAAVNELSVRIKERTEQFAEMTRALEQSRAELNGQLNNLQSLGSAVARVSTQLSAFETELKGVSSASMSTELKDGLMNVQKAIHSSLDASKAIESTMRDVLFFMRERVTEERSSGRN
jgi:predicted  nucleic acid-binding Zn-ribbon protein